MNPYAYRQCSTFWLLVFCQFWRGMCRVILKCHCRMLKARHILIGMRQIVSELNKFETLYSYCTLIF